MKQVQALAAMQTARRLLDEAEALLASVTLAVEEADVCDDMSMYVTGDVLSAAREDIAGLEELATLL